MHIALLQRFVVPNLQGLIGPRAALTAVLRGHPDGFLHWLGVLCSSWVTTSRGSTGRSLMNPEGDQSVPSVQYSNLMIARLLS